MIKIYYYLLTTKRLETVTKPVVKLQTHNKEVKKENAISKRSTK